MAEEKVSEAREAGTAEEVDKFSKRTVRMSGKHQEDCKQLLRLMGVPVVEAPCEAEAQCAALAKAGKVYAMASEDMDSLTFATPVLVRSTRHRRHCRHSPHAPTPAAAPDFIRGAQDAGAGGGVRQGD